MADINILIVGYVPFDDNFGKKPSEIKSNQYFKDLLAGFDLGNVYYAERGSYKDIIDKINPLVIIVFEEYIANEIKSCKNDAMLYVLCDPRLVFRRKNEAVQNQEENKRKLEEIAGMVKHIREGGEQTEKAARQFASMDYNQMYDMIVKSIIGDNEILKQKAWDLLTHNNVHENFVWMRAQLICDAWQHSDGKGREEFLCMAMNQHIENGMARKIEDFTGEDGQRYHQYAFNFFNGTDAKLIRRIPYGFPGQDKYAYEKLLDQNEVPTGPRMMLEAGQLKEEKEKHIRQMNKIYNLLKLWKANIAITKRELGLIPKDKAKLDSPLTEDEIKEFKDILLKYEPIKYNTLFP